jgi:isopropylmalate/homocitrate/citramalate synthase
MGRHSGARVLKHKLDSLKLSVPGQLLAELLAEIRRAATQQKSELNDEELKRLITEFQKHHGLLDL